ncbi:MAG: hypothetical protein KH828_10700 [Clostridiales bacterium]|nr:hypothetical protein [Clostridiales bacterium]
MNPEVCEAVSIAMRFLIWQLGTLFVYALGLIKMCGLKKSPWLLIFSLIIKLIIVNNFMSIYMEYYGYKLSWYRGFYGVIALNSSFFMFFAMNRCLKGNLSKHVLASVMGDLLSSFNFFPIILVNWMQGRKDILAILVPVSVSDIWYLVFTVIQCSLLFYLLSPLLKKFQTVDIKGKTIGYSVFLIYVLSCVNVTIGNTDGALEDNLRHGLIHLMAAELYLFYCYQKYRGIRRSILKQQKQLLEFHYQLIQHRSEEVENIIAALDIQREAVLSAKSDMANEQIMEYANQLKSAYQNMGMKHYCADRLLDAFFCYQEEVCRRHRIQTDFAVEVQSKDGLEEQDLLQLLIQLMEYVVKENQKDTQEEKRFVRLHIYSVKNQFFIECSFRSDRVSIPKDIWKRCCKKYKGIFRQENTGEKENVVIMLQKGEKKK